MLHAARYLKLEEPKIYGSSILIVGAGSSAERSAVETVRKNYDTVVTLNSALFVCPEADYHSFEFATKDEQMCREMIEWLNPEVAPKIVVKPHSIWPMSGANRKLLRERSRLVLNLASNGPQPRQANLNKLIGLKQHHYPSYAKVESYHRLVKKQRPLYQWHGSLSVWMDLTHRSTAVKRLGLIGTDFGGPYASDARWFNPSETSKTHLLQKNRLAEGGPLPFLTILSYLVGKGYLSDKVVEHHHQSEKLSEVLG